MTIEQLKPLLHMVYTVAAICSAAAFVICVGTVALAGIGAD